MLIVQNYIQLDVYCPELYRTCPGVERCGWISGHELNSGWCGGKARHKEGDDDDNCDDNYDDHHENYNDTLSSVVLIHINT